MKTMKRNALLLALTMLGLVATAQSVREIQRLDDGWKFAFGHAAEPAKDFGCGTEYFNYLTKANSIHNEGPYAMKFDDSAWQEVDIPHDFKVRGVKGYVWLIINAATRAVIGYQVSDNRGVGPCIMAMRMAFQHLEKLPDGFRFIADGYSAYLLAAQQFFHKFGENFKFDVTQVIGLTNEDAVSEEFRPYKQMIERLNRTYKASYRPTNGFDNYDGAGYDLALWVAYYNFLRPHTLHHSHPPVEDDVIKNGDNMPGKWQLMIFLGQQTIKKMQETA